MSTNLDPNKPPNSFVSDMGQPSSGSAPNNLERIQLSLAAFFTCARVAQHMERTPCSKFCGVVRQYEGELPHCFKMLIGSKKDCEASCLEAQRFARWHDLN